ncbi:MAG: DUF3782 domain-containing protein [Candidatus Competibacteraceae bacterium]|nr:DUF3782 domain-containing protein [Candidatus Competibacteraceae bacterium]MBK8961769.1 DUF3782 domain-containing protein [Candidatus Competibacteraceae bacterium]
MDVTDLKAMIRRELPGLLRDDPSLHNFLLELMRQEHPSRAETEDRFSQLLGELRRDREEQNRKWEEQNRKWDENQAEMREEFRKLYEQQNRDRQEQNHRWEVQNIREEEHKRKWEDNQKELQRLHEAVMAQASKHDRSIGALGARWGMQSEKTFRDALAGILEKNFDVRVLNVNEYDDQGEVFGRPDQVELDIIVMNGLLLICELKSSIDKAGIYAFECKARFYERRHDEKADRLLVISPMVDARARKVAEQLGIELYSDLIDVKAL